MERELMSAEGWMAWFLFWFLVGIVIAHVYHR